MAYLTIEHLTFSYPLTKEKALSDVSMAVEKGELVLLCGASGCGKTTLLSHLKPCLTPSGVRKGRVCLEGVCLEELSARQQAAKIGYVFQDPQAQLVTDKVWHELAYGLENLGLPSEEIRLRVGEMASYFGLQELFHASVNALSGGQKQLVNLAAVMAMDPDVLVLDEPTSQLDPIAAASFLDMVCRINRELGTTVILSEHRTEEIFGRASQVAVMAQGRLAAFDPPAQVGAALAQTPYMALLPSPVRIASALGWQNELPLTVAGGSRYLAAYAAGHPCGGALPDPEPSQTPPVLTLHEVWFRYEKDSPDVLRSCSFQVPRGGIYAILGGNGSGKSTLLRTIAGLQRPYRGWIQWNGKRKRPADFGVALLPQDPKHLFVGKTLREDLAEMSASEEQIQTIAQQLAVDHLLERHPYDLSGGELQRAALAKVLLAKPSLLLLDEPTKGMDAMYKPQFARLLQQLLATGITILLVSHDVEFCAQYATLAALFFDGGVLAQGTARKFFAANRYYTTSARRMSREILPNAITAQEVVQLCQSIE